MTSALAATRYAGPPGVTALAATPEIVSIQSLTAAVASSDVPRFTEAVARLAGVGPVRLADAAGQVLAETPATSPGRPARGFAAARHRVLTLHDGAHVLGALTVPAGCATGLDALLTDLGSALLRARQERLDHRELRHRLAVLDCVFPAGEWLRSSTVDFAATQDTTYRPVVISAREKLEGLTGRRVLCGLQDRAARHPVLHELHLVLHQGVIVGVCPDTGASSPHDQSAGWTQLLRFGSFGVELMATVGRPGAAGAELREQCRMAQRVAQLQRDDCPFLQLPAVAVVEELGPIAEVLLASGQGPIAPFLERVLGDLLRDRRFDGQLIETVYAYLRTGGSVRGSAALLHLHPSSVKYRIRVMRELLGHRLEDQRERFELEFAVRIYLAVRQLRRGDERS